MSAQEHFTATDPDGAAAPPRHVPPPAAALADIVSLARSAVQFEHEAFAADEPVEGSATVEFLADWRSYMIDALAVLDATKGDVGSR